MAKNATKDPHVESVNFFLNKETLGHLDEALSGQEYS